MLNKISRILRVPILTQSCDGKVVCFDGGDKKCKQIKLSCCNFATFVALASNMKNLKCDLHE